MDTCSAPFFYGWLQHPDPSFMQRKESPDLLSRSGRLFFSEVLLFVERRERRIHRSEFCHAGKFLHGLHRAYFEAISAFHTGILGNGEFLFPAASDAAYRAFTSTERAADALLFIDLEMHQIEACAG